MGAYRSNGARLRSHTLRLRAAEHPYYLHSPRGEHERAPGWYWRPAGAERPEYLGCSHIEAEIALRTLRAAPPAAAA